MKKLLILLFSLLISFNSYGKTICYESNSVQNRNGLFYLPNQQEPFTGDNLCKYSWGGQYKSKGNILNGLPVGKWTIWYQNGQIGSESNYKDGKPDGKWTRWHENGQKKSERNWKDNKLDGKQTWWYENGQIEEEGNWKDNKKDGKWTYWWGDGKVKAKTNWKDGKEDGKWSFWWGNGETIVGIYKDGKRISGDFNRTNSLFYSFF